MNKVPHFCVALSSLFLNLVLAAAACFAQQSPSPGCVVPASADVHRLEAGTVIKRDLAGGPTHFYEVNVSSGQFLRLIVDQKGIDVEATICTPDGREAARVDRPNGAYGPKAISLLADQSGLFTLQVKATLEKAVAGRYEVLVAEQRGALPD